VVTNRDCDNCDKFVVCAYLRMFQSLKADAVKLLSEYNKGEIFEVEVKCTQWTRGRFGGSEFLERFLEDYPKVEVPLVNDRQKTIGELMEKDYYPQIKEEPPKEEKKEESPKPKEEPKKKKGEK